MRLSLKVLAVAGLALGPIQAVANSPDIDPQAFAVRLDLPQGVALMPDGVVVTVSAKQGWRGEKRSVRLVMVPGATSDEYVLSASDQRDLASLIHQITKAKAAGGKVKGALSLGLSPCRTQQDLPHQPRASFAMRRHADLGFEAVAQSVPVTRLAETSLKEWPRCPQ